MAMKHDDFMGSAVIDQQDKIVGHRGPIQDELRTTLGSGSRWLGRFVGIGLDADMIEGLAIPKVKFNVRPMMRQAGLDAPAVGTLIDTEQRLHDQTVHPTGGAGVPSPTSTSRVWLHAVNIGSNDVGFHAIAVDRFLSIRMG
jgi:hypothetical protein